MIILGYKHKMIIVHAIPPVFVGVVTTLYSSFA